MVSEQFERCHWTLLQYVEFLCSAFTPAAAYAQLIPSFDDPVHLYHLDPEVAFLIYRPVMRLFKCQRSGLNCLTLLTILPSKAWNSRSPDLYATFWGLTLYDLCVPRNRFESEIAKQHVALKALEELPGNSSSAINKRKKDKERIQEALARLTSELYKHEENVASVCRQLSREKDKWLTSCPDTLKINTEFLQRCIFPRCTFINHIDVLICKTLQPMKCCCTEYEAGRLGRMALVSSAKVILLSVLVGIVLCPTRLMRFAAIFLLVGSGFVIQEGIHPARIFVSPSSLGYFENSSYFGASRHNLSAFLSIYSVFHLVITFASLCTGQDNNARLVDMDMISVISSDKPPCGAVDFFIPFINVSVAMELMKCDIMQPNEVSCPRRTVFHAAGQVLIESACSVDRVEEALRTLLPMLPEIQYFRFNPVYFQLIEADVLPAPFLKLPLTYGH
ncbi:hypothetical protein COLO4_04150 [Corchorus olitorius]|uniref:THO complex subunitTHOC2 C-terminal domain-containing protein n=1 Tax=Corchorus olitorius TaxID=93759 RepID=A0A1R3KV55_9ROSI|nr:hypothetical protein COLO4_04150 [Corchorus olitorius]